MIKLNVTKLFCNFSCNISQNSGSVPALFIIPAGTGPNFFPSSGPEFRPERNSGASLVRNVFDKNDFCFYRAFMKFYDMNLCSNSAPTS